MPVERLGLAPNNSRRRVPPRRRSHSGGRWESPSELLSAVAQDGGVPEQRRLRASRRADLLGQVVGFDAFAAAEGESALHSVLQLPHVAGPRVPEALVGLQKLTHIEVGGAHRVLLSNREAPSIRVTGGTPQHVFPRAALRSQRRGWHAFCCSAGADCGNANALEDSTNVTTIMVAERIAAKLSA
jgi:hypothetical protein